MYGCVYVCVQACEKQRKRGGVGCVCVHMCACVYYGQDQSLMILLAIFIMIVAKENVPLPQAHHTESRALPYGGRHTHHI